MLNQQFMLVMPFDDYKAECRPYILYLYRECSGATVGTNKTINVTIVDNDKSYYTIFGGQWKFSGIYGSVTDGVTTSDNFTYNMTIGAASDPNNDDYEFFLGLTSAVSRLRRCLLL